MLVVLPCIEGLRYQECEIASTKNTIWKGGVRMLKLGSLNNEGSNQTDRNVSVDNR